MLLLLVGILMCNASDTAGHPLNEICAALIFDIQDDRVECNLMMSPPAVVFLTNRSDPEPARTQWNSDIVDEGLVTAFVRQDTMVKIDDIVVQPVFVSLCFNGEVGNKRPDPAAPWYLQTTYSYPIKSPPKKIEVTWMNRAAFPAIRRHNDLARALGVSTNGNTVAGAISGIIRLGSSGQDYVFSEDEPQFTWHAPATAPKAKVVVIAPPRARENSRLIIPVLLAAMVSVLITVVILRRRVSAPIGLAAVLVVCVLGAMVVMFRSRSADHLPHTDEALEQFKVLHQNIYRAFDYRREEEIYDVLSQSVTGPALDEIYQEVYQSLILRDQGGAIATVKSVEMLADEILPPDDDSGRLQYRVKAHWRVRGVVSHWGHIHSRINEYKAVYTVAAVDGTWKIAGTELLMQERVKTN